MTADVQDLISQVPPAEEIRLRIQEKTREIAVLRSLFRAARKIERTRAEEQQQEEGRGPGAVTS
jgi:hypothetical protein